jgi:hypothetical protein
MFSSLEIEDFILLFVASKATDFRIKTPKSWSRALGRWYTTRVFMG